MLGKGIPPADSRGDATVQQSRAQRRVPHLAVPLQFLVPVLRRSLRAASGLTPSTSLGMVEAIERDGAREV